jgi:uncharacterized protein YlxW (UPF0749 family)
LRAPEPRRPGAPAPAGRRAVIAAVVLLLGLMLGLEFRVYGGKAASIGPDRLGDMAVLLLSTERKNAQLTKEIAALRAELIARERGQNQYRALLQELEAARAMAGLTPVTGPGVVVELTEPAGQGTTGPLSIHDTDILLVLNELRAAGATALAVNGQRIVATSEIRQAGDVFSINNTPAAPPFTIVAVGPPATLAAALELQGGTLDVMASMGIGVKVTELKKVTVPAYQGSP